MALPPSLPSYLAEYFPAGLADNWKEVKESAGREGAMGAEAGQLRHPDDLPHHGAGVGND